MVKFKAWFISKRFRFRATTNDGICKDSVLSGTMHSAEGNFVWPEFLMKIVDFIYHDSVGFKPHTAPDNPGDYRK